VKPLPTVPLAIVALVITGAPPVTVPVRLTLWGLPLALSVRVTAALRVPLAVGVKVTLIVQLPPTATLAPQLLLCPKSPAFVPVSIRLLTTNAALPVLLTVMVCAPLLLPTPWLAKVRAAGLILAMVGWITVKLTELLAAPFCITQTVPDCEPPSTSATICVSLQLLAHPQLVPSHTPPLP